VWDEGRKEFREDDTGEVLTAAALLALVDASIAGSTAAGETLADLLQDGALTTDLWERQFGDEVKREYIRQYLLGRGGLGMMEDADWEEIGTRVEEQLSFLEGMAAVVALGELTDGQIRARMAMYINSARAAFERGVTVVVGGRKLVLPAYPGDGSTRCRTNCRCHWEIEEVVGPDGTIVGWSCYWRLGTAEHCDDCVARAADWAPLFVEA
jgi:hypothetical protein